MFNGVKSLKEFCCGKGLRLSLIAVILGIMMLAPMVSAAEDVNPGVYPVDSVICGKTYGEWSAEWWKWILAIPTSSNPFMDDGSGEFCAEGQSGDVWFLAGSWVGTTKLNCEVPAGKAIFFPIFNNECSKIEGYGETQKELRDSTNSIIDCVTVTEVKVDGKRLKNLDDYRAESKLFVFKLPEDNVLEEFGWIVPEFEGARSSPAVSDGYWIMLEPLSEGEHKIYVYGKAVFDDGSTFETKMTYCITVV
jgi:hypothetical protein